MQSAIGRLAAISQVLEEHRPRLLAMVSRRIDAALLQRVDPEEVLSEAFIKASRQSSDPKQQNQCPSYSWLYRLTLDCLIDAWRRETCVRRDLRRELPFPAESSAQLGLGLIGKETSPSNRLARKQLQERMTRVLDLLKPQDREILWMRHYDQLTHREAAEVLGIKESATTLRYVRALKRLKDLWKAMYGEQ